MKREMKRRRVVTSAAAAPVAEVETWPEVLYLVRAWTETSPIIYASRAHIRYARIEGIKEYRAKRRGVI